MALVKRSETVWGFGLRRERRPCSASGSAKELSCHLKHPLLRSTTKTPHGRRKRQHFGVANYYRRCLRKGRFGQFQPPPSGSRRVGQSLKRQGASATLWTSGPSTTTFQCPSVNTRHWHSCRSLAGKEMQVCRQTCNPAIMPQVYILISSNYCVFKWKISITFIQLYLLALTCHR